MNYKRYLSGGPYKLVLADVQFLLAVFTHSYKVHLRRVCPDPLNQIIPYVWVAIFVKLYMCVIYVHRSVP